MKTLFIFLLLSTSALAENCSYTLNQEKTKIEWEAYKTLAKAGVKGSFDLVEIKNIKAQSSESKIFNGLAFSINTHSVNSGDKGRDKKLKEHFFTVNNAPLSISGVANNYKKKMINVAFNINGVKKDIPLKVKKYDNKLTATGTIDMFDFGLHTSLMAINKACSLLHSGKTWNDVKISIAAEVSKECKN